MSLLISRNEYISIDNDTRENRNAVHPDTCMQLLAYVYVWLQRLIGYPRKMSTSIFHYRSIEMDDSSLANLSKSSLLHIRKMKITDALHLNKFKENASLFYYTLSTSRDFIFDGNNKLLISYISLCFREPCIYSLISFSIFEIILF